MFNLNHAKQELQELAQDIANNPNQPIHQLKEIALERKELSTKFDSYRNEFRNLTYSVPKTITFFGKSFLIGFKERSKNNMKNG